jgi:hypothetical protein
MNAVYCSALVIVSEVEIHEISNERVSFVNLGTPDDARYDRREEQKAQ